MEKWLGEASQLRRTNQWLTSWNGDYNPALIIYTDASEMKEWLMRSGRGREFGKGKTWLRWGSLEKISKVRWKWAVEPQAS